MTVTDETPSRTHIDQLIEEILCALRTYERHVDEDSHRARAIAIRLRQALAAARALREGV